MATPEHHARARILVNALATRAGGAANRLRQVAARAPRAWNADILILRTSEVRLDHPLPARVVVSGWPFPLSHVPALPRRAAESLVLRHHIRSFEPSAVVHYGTYVPIDRFNDFLNALCFISLAPWDPGPASSTARNRMLRWLFERSRHRADVIIVQSRATSHFLAQLYPDIAARLVVVRNGLAVDGVTIPTCRRDFMMVGDVYGYRRIPDVVRAYAALPAQVRSRHALLIAGHLGRDRRAVAEVKAAIAEAAVQDVRLLGLLPRNEVLERMAGACAFLSYASVENGPNAVMEAAALGTPSILSAIPGHHEFAASGSMFVDDTDQLIRALIDAAAAAADPGPGSIAHVDTWDCHVNELGSVLKRFGALGARRTS